MVNALHRAADWILRHASAAMRHFDQLDPRLQGAIVIFGIVAILLVLALADFLLARALAWWSVRRAVRQRQPGALRGLRP